MKTLLIICLFFIFNITHAQLPFEPLKKITNTEFQLAPKLSYQILFQEGDAVSTNDGKVAPAKGHHDYNCFIPNEDNPNKGTLFVSHECNDSSTILGDGGGATLITLSKSDRQWNVVLKENIGFSNVGGTYNNCSGVLTSNNKILSAEEFPPNSNKNLFKKGKGFRDTSDFLQHPRWQNMGWMVEVDVKTKKATQKLFSLGRYSHEGAIIMPDNKTMFLTDDHSPSVFFKFIADSPNEFDKGQLYAYRQETDRTSGKWIPLPMEIDSLLIARDVALRLGATFFLRMEWLTYVDGKIYITETGTADFDYSKKNCFNGNPAEHLSKIMTINNNKETIDFPFGAVLMFDPNSNTIQPLLKGGESITSPKKYFYNPDGITFCRHKNKTYLVINEDNIQKLGKDIPYVKKLQNTNKIWWLDLSIKKPQIDDLQLFLLVPEGAESTGGYFTPDYKSYFVNIQHPNSNNIIPWNKSSTIVISGW
ncbi:MAG: DUF839 domain-containing protein [Cytophagales bacterium]|nr:MAG: DUF839 domain-containing protein [Cytophagales bacterium]